MFFANRNKGIKSILALVLAVGMLLSSINVNATETTPAADTETTDATTGTTWASHTPIVKSETELRGIWLAVVDYYALGLSNASETTFRKKAAKFVNNSAALGCNAIFLHVRSFDDAIWSSKTFNASSYLSGTANSKKRAYKVYKQYDPLKVFIEEAHKGGLELHAYMNPYRVSSSVYLDPALKSSRERVLTAVKEVCQYDIDGVHFDDYFYHASKYKNLDTGKTYSVSISASKKRSNVNKLIRSVYKEVSKYPGKVFGIAPQGNYDNDMGSGADVKTWMSKTGYIDYCAPQIYWSDAYGEDGEVTMFTDRLKQFKALAVNPAIKFYVGLALYRGGSYVAGDPGWEDSNTNIKRQVAKIRKIGGSGYILFTGRFLYTKATKTERKKLLEYLNKDTQKTTASLVMTSVNKGAKSGWVKTSGGKKMYYKGGKFVTGVNKIKKKYYYFTADGILKTSDFKIGKVKYYVGADSTLIGIKTGKKYCYATGVAMTDTDATEMKAYLKARSIMKNATTSKMSLSEKRLACFKWVQKHPYKLNRKFNPSLDDWTALYAMDVYKRGGSDCHGDAAAFAYLALALGYDNVYICNDSDGTRGTAGGHCWCEIDGRIFDPLFAEAKVFSEHYNVAKAGYYGHPVIHKKVMYMSPSHAKSQVVLVESKEGLAKVKGEYYFFKNGKAISQAWKSIDGEKYYFGEDCKALRGGVFRIDETYYIFKKDGKLAKGDETRVITVNDKKYQVAASGKAKSGWSGDKFYDAAGRLVTGTVAIGGAVWVFDEKGVFNESETGLLAEAMIEDAPIADVIAVLGEPNTRDYSPSCLAGEDDSEDGAWDYDSIRVVTLKRPDGTELYKTVLPLDDPILEETVIKARSGGNNER